MSPHDHSRDLPAPLTSPAPPAPMAPASPFDSASLSYDRDFSELPAVQDLRQRIYGILAPYWRQGAAILDLGCGTGEDALHFARQGCTVTAVDPSAGMLTVAARKLSGLPSPVTLLQTDALHLDELVEGPFDGILSNFGALNCVEDLGPVLERCAALLNENGILALCLINPYSVWETGAFLARGKFSPAFRRWTKGRIDVPAASGTIPTWYHPVGKVKRQAKRYFETEQIIGLNFLAPPPGSRSFAGRHPGLTGLLVRGERRLEAHPLCARLGDHVLIVLRRNGTTLSLRARPHRSQAGATRAETSRSATTGGPR